MLTIPNLDLAVLRGSMRCDVFGCYLLLLSAVFYLPAFMKPRTPWAAVATYGGAAYLLPDAMGASILAVSAPPTAAADAATAGQKRRQAQRGAARTALAN